MSFTRSHSIDVTRPDADTEHTAVMDLDADLTGAFSHLNDVDAIVQAKMLTSASGAASGVCELGADGLVPVGRLPVYPQEKLPAFQGYPIGSVLPFAGVSLSSAMTGKWLECDGALLDQATYPALFAVMGVRFGSTSGSNFRVPDLRGRFVRGWDHNAGNDPNAVDRGYFGDISNTGDHVSTYQSGQNLKHKHNLLSYGATLSNGDGGVGTEYYSNGPNNRAIVSTTGSAEFRPVNVQMQYVIRVL